MAHLPTNPACPIHRFIGFKSCPASCLMLPLSTKQRGATAGLKKLGNPLARILSKCIDVHSISVNIFQWFLFLVRTPRGRRGVLSFFHVYVVFEESISFHILHFFLARRCIFCAFCCVSWRACGDSCVFACQALFRGVGWGGGVGGCWGGLITFLFINVPASSFLTRFSLLQVTVWHAVDVSVLICWRWCPVACGHGVGFGGD